MSGGTRVKRSSYMEWAKLHSHVRNSLASSGLVNYPFSGLPVRLDELELTGDSYYGYAPLQEAIAGRCGTAKEQVFATIGTSLANHIAFASLLDPHDEVLVEQPTYELLLSTLGYLGATVRRFPRRFENGFAIDPGDVERAITPRTRLIVLTNLHNPSSALTGEPVLRRIGELAKSVGARVVVDEVYLDAAFELAPRSSIHLGSEFVVTNSLTKVYGLSGLRCGWVLADPGLIRKMWLLNDLFEVIPAHPAERLSVIAFQHLNRIREHSRKLLEKNHRLLNAFLDSRSELECFRPGFGTVVFPLLKTGSPDALEEVLRSKYESAVVPGRFFEMPAHFRIGVGGRTETVEAGLRALGNALDELARGR